MFNQLMIKHFFVYLDFYVKLRFVVLIWKFDEEVTLIIIN